jgi:hypothetical protein
MRTHILLAASVMLLGLCQSGNTQTASSTPPKNEERRALETQVAVQLQVVSIPDAVFEKVVTPDWLATHRAGSFEHGRLALLNDAERKELMTSLHQDKRTETLASPTLRMLNGQNATIDMTEEMYFLTEVNMEKIDGKVVPVPKNERKELGLKAKIQVTVSADRRYVQIDLDATRSALQSSNIPLVPVQVPAPPAFVDEGKRKQMPVMQMFVQQPSIAMQKVGQRFNVPDGGTTVIVAGKEQRETRQVSTHPLAVVVPYGQQLFGSVTLTRESRTVVLFVTPRIVINEEIEREILGIGTPTKPRNEPNSIKRGTYSTGGLLKPGRHELPLDYEMTVIDALASAGIFGRVYDGRFQLPWKELEKDLEERQSKPAVPAQVVVLRRDGDGLSQRVVDVDKAFNNRTENLVIRHGDVLILQEIPSRSPTAAAKESRPDAAQVYYTGGIDIPRQHPLPQNREWKVTQAIAGKLTRVGPDDPLPSEVLVIRRTKSGEQTQIRVSLARALLDPSHDPVVQNGDFLVLQESPADTLARMTRGIARDVANIRLAPRDLSEPSEPPPSMPRR